LGAAALFGASTPAAKLLLRALSPLMLSALLYLGATIALSVYRFLAFQSRESQISRRDLPLICGVIFFGGIVGPILMFLGLQRLSALTGSLLLNLEGPFTALFAVGLLREHLGRRETFAAAAIMLGGVLVGFQPGLVAGSWIGALEITVACLSRDFRFDSPIPTRRVHRTAFLCKGLAGFGSTVFPAAPGGAGFASGGHATPGDALFPNGSADTFPCALASSSKSAPRCARLIPPATAAPRSSAACRQTAAASDGSPPAEASSNVRA
jgi:drug/metabolite transporter (DMT)-like permease